MDEKTKLMIDAKVRESKKLDLSVIEPIVRKVWGRETASPGCQNSWSPQNPAWGQCAVTALLIEDIEGGEILRAVIEGFGSHYYNRLSSWEVDLTRSQFPEGTIIPPGEPVKRDDILNSERAIQARTKERYEKLKDRFHRLVLFNLIVQTMRIAALDLNLTL